MNYTEKLKYHYRPKKGWVNDPNGLIYFGGYYHLFYQYCPNFEKPWEEPVYWGHARTRDFLNWEELPIAISPDKDYDKDGCWSGTAIEKDGVLYLFYASIKGENKDQSVSVAYSRDGITFEKYEGNPVIEAFPEDGCPDFRDPALCYIDGKYYLVMASGHIPTHTARLLLYESDDLLNWKYSGIMKEWENCKYAECPSFVNAGSKQLLATSVLHLDLHHNFTAMYGRFEKGKFFEECSAEVDKGPDQYAGQIFTDGKGRNILISWLPGWDYVGYADKDIGCFSVPREFKEEKGVITAYPIEEMRHLLKDEDESVKRTDDGFIIERTGRDPVVYKGNIEDIKILRDGYIVEVYVNGGKEIFTALL
ncbi:MAG: glycoside hydrolase family 32 protein [Ruminococcaceae bacterium]|nr:glycoside hydrolase family 32 protein [Oscillospiraceae bacterium]